MELRDFIQQLKHQMTSPAIVMADAQGLRLGGLDIKFGIVGGVKFRHLVSNMQGLRVHVKEDMNKFQLEPELSKHFACVARRLRKSALRHGRKLNNGKLVRLMKFTLTKRHTLKLRVQRTDYFTFMATNLNLKEAIWPVGTDHENVSLAKHYGDALFNLNKPYMANALNVIAMLVTADGFTFLPRRSSAVYERPNTLQASVGGSVCYKKDGPEPPLEALKREILEEWGIEVADSECRFLALGINRHTGEPDLIAIVKTGKMLVDVIGSYVRLDDTFEFANYRTIPLSIDRIDDLVLPLVSEMWSQPSDQAAYLMMLFAQFPNGSGRIESSIKKLISSSPSQRC
jgi:8-oxo-dGTP pyrophosphatase MutT (NUDIX family)